MTFEELKCNQLLHYLFLDSLSPSVRSFVIQREPKSAIEAANFADLSYSILQQNMGSKVRPSQSRVNFLDEGKVKEVEHVKSESESCQVEQKTSVTGRVVKHSRGR